MSNTNHVVPFPAPHTHTHAHNPSAQDLLQRELDAAMEPQFRYAYNLVHTRPLAAAANTPRPLPNPCTALTLLWWWRSRSRMQQVTKSPCCSRYTCTTCAP